MAAALSSRFLKGLTNLQSLRSTRVASASLYQNGVMRYSTTVPSDSDTHDDFKPTQKVPSGSTGSLKDIMNSYGRQMYEKYGESFKRKALRVIAEFLSSQEVEDIKEMFNKMDTDKDGIVTIEELKAGLRDFGTQLAESEVQMLIEAVDTKGKGTLDYGEFVAVSLHLQKVANDEHLRKAFSYFDKDGNGYILPQELCEALKEDGGDDCVDVANDIFQEVDTDKVSVKSSMHEWYDLSYLKDLSFLQDYQETKVYDF